MSKIADEDIDIVVKACALLFEEYYTKREENEIMAPSSFIIHKCKQIVSLAEAEKAKIEALPLGEAIDHYFGTSDWRKQDDRKLPIDLKLRLPLDHLCIAVRATNVLASANINTIGEIVNVTPHELMQLPNFGRKSLRHVIEALHQIGMAKYWAQSLKDAGKDSWPIKSHIRTLGEEKNEL